MTASLLIVLAYFAGSIPFGVLLTRWKAGTDVRAHGSGNIGATNVARVAGKKVGVVVFLLDALKGVLPVLLARAVLPAGYYVHAAVAFAAFMGHVFPLWLRFRGGKGVATAFGALLSLTPMAALFGIACYAGVFLLTRISSLGSLSGATVTCIAMWVWRVPLSYQVLSTLLLLFLFWTHRENLKRLLQRSEKGF